jgi:hypothetical protein
MRRRRWMLLVGALALGLAAGAGGPAGAGSTLPLTVSISPTSGPAGTFISVTTPECDATEGINYAIFPAGAPIDGTPIVAVGPIVAPGPFGIEFPDGQEAGEYQVAAYCDDVQQQPREGSAPFSLQVPAPSPPIEPVAPAAAPAGPVAADPGFTG